MEFALRWADGDEQADKPTYEEVLGLVEMAFAEGISNAIDELE